MKSLIVIVAVAAIATGATGAYFTSDVTVHGVTASTGTIIINDVSADWMQPVNLGLLKPGDLVRKWVRVQNNGTLPIGTLTVSAVNRVDTYNLLGQLTGWTYGTIAGTTDDPNGVQTGYNNDASILLNNANLLSPANHILLPGQTTTIQVQLVVPTTMDDSWQGRTSTFDLQFHAEQVH